MATSPPTQPASRKYAGKVNFEDLESWLYVGEDTKYTYRQLYAQRLYSKRYHRSLLVVLVPNTKTSKYVLLASTDLQQEPQQVGQYYQLRFQRGRPAIEFVFREAKQFTGLTHCQAREEAKLVFHLNRSLSAVNIARVALDQSYVNSRNAFMGRQTNQRIAELIYQQLSTGSSVDFKQYNALNFQVWPKMAA